MNSVLQAALNKRTGVTDKYDCYFGAYEFRFEKLKDKSIKFLEIGVNRSGGVNTWAEFFQHGEIVGIDMNPACTEFRSDRIDIHIGDQEDRHFLTELSKQYGQFDIVLDDGGHTMKQQIASFEALFPLLRENGIYAIEDLHTSYWPEFGGKLNGASTCITYLKELVDCINWWSQRSERAGGSRNNGELTWKEKSISSIHFHDSTVFIYKGNHTKPHRKQF